MTTGAIAPDPPRLANPDAQHLRTEIATKQAQCRTMSGAQLSKQTSER